MMAISSTVLLLAASSVSVIAGPVPKHLRRQIFASYGNISTIASSATVAQSSISAVDISSAFLPSTSAPSQSSPVFTTSPSSTFVFISTRNPVEAETAVVVEPIQKTVFTSIMPAITFLNPQGVAIDTQEAQTILLTSYFTPTPAPKATAAPEQSSSILSIVSETPSPVTSLKASNVVALSSAGTSATPVSSQLPLNNDTASATSRSLPVFSYSPIEEQSGTSSVSLTATASSEQPVPTSGRLPGFNHPGSASRSSVSKISSSVASSAGQASPSTSPANSTSSRSSSLLSPILSTPTPSEARSTRRVFVTKTEYTTIYPASSSQAVPLASVAPTGAQNDLSAQPSSSKAAAVPTASAQPQPQPSPIQSVSSAVALPSTLLAPPPIIIVTQYTTVTPVPESIPTGTPAVPQPAPIASVSSAAYANSSTPSAATPTPTPSSAVLPPQATPSTSRAASVPTSAPPTPSSSSEGPLIINPIGSSQITVTVTTTERETIRETATVTVTAR